MSQYHASTTTFRFAHEGSAGLALLGAEVRAFLVAILYPGKLVREVEQMGRLLAEAQRIEASDPHRASVLRRRASRACL